MKPKRTWIVIANARLARFVEHHGAGHGLMAEPGMVLHADPPIEHSDRAGTGHSIAGPGEPAVDMADPQKKADEAFAQKICATLHQALSDQKFDRVLVVAGPHFLGYLRKYYHPDVANMVMSELNRDLTAMPLPELEKHLGSVLYV